MHLSCILTYCAH